MTDLDVRVGDRVLRLSSLDRVLWPGSGTTKAQLVEHLLATSEALLPHVADRPLTLRRFPEGVGGPSFFQTRTPPHPDWVRTVELSYERTGKAFDVPVLDDVAGLVWAANLTTLELHPFLAPTGRLDRPHAVVLDLDPGAPAGLLEACEVGLLLRTALEAAGLASYPKSSGGKGLHVYVPVEDEGYEQTKAFARGLARALTSARPDLVVATMTKRLRTGRVLVDWSQNDPGKSTVAAYSPRAGLVPTVSTPLTWREVEQAVRRRDPSALVASFDGIRARLADHGDLFAPVLRGGQRLPAG